MSGSGRATGDGGTGLTAASEGARPRAAAGGNSDALAGRHILLVRAGEGNEALRRHVEASGATVSEARVLRVVPSRPRPELDRELGRLSRYDWLVFTSASAVRAVAGRLSDLGIGTCAFGSCRVAAVGPATADELRGHGLEVSLIATQHDSSGLLEAMRREPKGKVLLPQSALAGAALSDGLTEVGFTVTQVVAYELEIDEAERARAASLLSSGDVDAVVFASPSGLETVLDVVPPGSLSATVIAIGPRTASACNGHGISIGATAAAPTGEGLVKAITNALSESTEAKRD